MKTLLTLFLIAAFAVTSSAQKFSHNIKDVWRCYSALKDTVEKGEGGLYVVFGDTSMIMFATMGGAFLPLGEEEKYIFKNDSLTTLDKKGTTKVKVTFHSSNLISYPDFLNNKRIYLVRKNDDN